MKAAYVGAGGDRLGFALTGIEIVECSDPSQAEATLAAIAARSDLALLLASERFAAQAPLGLAALQRRGPPPAVAVLPEAEP